jgi:hypothetical protein
MSDKIRPADRRYPYALVWTPLHPITWIAPYVGHCGVADAEGRVIDFQGPYTIGQDCMLFGWPTRCLILDDQKSAGQNAYDSRLYEMAYRYERQHYDFVCWNCHSLVAGLLNSIEHPRDAVAKCFRGWTVVGVACLFFFRSRHIGALGFVQTWGGHLLIWLLVLYQSRHEQSLQLVRSWLLLQLSFLCVFLGWYTALTIIGLNSQYGRARPRSLPPSPALHAVVGVSDLADADELSRCITGDSCLSSAPTVVVGGAAAASLYKAGLRRTSHEGSDSGEHRVDHVVPDILRVASEEDMKMRVDSFGDLVPDCELSVARTERRQSE